MSDESQNDAGGNKGGAGGAVERPSWLDSAPDAHKNNKAFYQFKEPVQVYDKLDALLKAEQSMVVVPGKDAKPEEVAAFYQKLGRPENVDGYEITKPADFPEGITFDEEGIKVFKQFAHEQGFNKAQTEALFGWYCDLVKNGHAAEAQKKTESEAKANEEALRTQVAAVNALKSEWKDKFDENMAQAVIGFKTFAKDNPEAEKLLDVKVTDEKLGTIRLGDHPAFNRLFYAIATSMLGDSALSGRGGGAGNGEDSETKVAKEMFPSMNKK